MLPALAFTDTNSPFPGLSAIHSNWLSSRIPDRKDQNNQVFLNKGLIYDTVAWGYSFIAKITIYPLWDQMGKVCVLWNQYNIADWDPFYHERK